MIGLDSGEDYLRQKLFEQPWYEAYDGVKPLVVGHRAYLEGARPLLYPRAQCRASTGWIPAASTAAR